MLEFAKKDLHNQVEESKNFPINNEIKNLFENRIILKAKIRIFKDLQKLEQNFYSKNKLIESFGDDEIFSQSESLK